MASSQSLILASVRPALEGAVEPRAVRGRRSPGCRWRGRRRRGCRRPPSASPRPGTRPQTASSVGVERRRAGDREEVVDLVAGERRPRRSSRAARGARCGDRAGSSRSSRRSRPGAARSAAARAAGAGRCRSRRRCRRRGARRRRARPPSAPPRRPARRRGDGCRRTASTGTASTVTESIGLGPKTTTLPPEGIVRG